MAPLTPPATAVGDGATHRADDRSDAPGVMDLYRQLLGALATVVDQPRRALVLEAAFLVVYVVLRGMDADRTAMGAWTVGLAAMALVAPFSALTVVAGVAPFSEWLLLDRDTGLKVVIVALIGVGGLIRYLGETPRPRLGRLTVAAGLLWLGVALSVAMSAARFGPPFGERALVVMLAGIGGALPLLGVAVLAGRRGLARPAVVATGAIVSAAVVSLLDYVADTSIRASVFDWMLRAPLPGNRLTGVIPAPNAVAGLLSAGIAVLGAVAIFGGVGHGGRDRLLRVVAAALAVALGIGVLLTFSRSGLVSLAILVVLWAAWWRPRAGLAVLALGAVLAVVAVPLYLQVRAGAIGAGAVILDGGLLTQADLERLGAWAASLRMIAERPLLGHGFLAFRELHEQYGSPNITAPHNELLRLAAESGLVVAVLFGVVMATIAVRLWRSRILPGLAGVGALTALLVAGAYNNPFLYVQITVPVFTIVGVGLGLAERAARREAEAAGEGPRDPAPSEPGGVRASVGEPRAAPGRHPGDRADPAIRGRTGPG